MKVAIPISNNQISSHFGHCEAFAFFTVENGIVTREETLEPPVHEPGSHPRFLHEQGCSVVISGGMGTRAQELMHANGIETIVGVPQLPLNEIISCYLEGKLESGSNRCDH